MPLLSVRVNDVLTPLHTCSCVLMAKAYLACLLIGLRFSVGCTLFSFTPVQRGIFVRMDWAVPRARLTRHALCSRPH